LTEAIAQWLEDLNLFSVVTTGGAQRNPTHRMEGEITELYGDYREIEAPQARLAMSLRLTRGERPAQQETLWQGRFAKSSNLPRAGAEELIEGWNQALAAICEEAAPLLAAAMNRA